MDFWPVAEKVFSNDLILQGRPAVCKIGDWAKGRFVKRGRSVTQKRPVSFAAASGYSNGLVLTDFRFKYLARSLMDSCLLLSNAEISTHDLPLSISSSNG
jgi:hypothetical protein